MPSPGPIPCSYWLIEGTLLAGEYPGTYVEADTREKLAKFLDAGIRTFINRHPTGSDPPLARGPLVGREWPRADTPKSSQTR